MTGTWRKGLAITAVALIGLGGFIALMITRSRPGRRPRPAVAPLVKVVTAHQASAPVVIHSMGGVRAARQVQLMPQVGGKVVRVNQRLIPGAKVKAGEVLVWIDPADYDLAVRAARAAVAEAELALDLQLGQRAVARRELQLLKDKVKLAPDRVPLASREAHVESARMQLDAAKSRVERALLDRRRTAVRAPFDARVSEKSVDVGQVVSPQAVLAILVASDEVWIEASLPVEQLRWIDLPDTQGAGGAPALIQQQLGNGAKATRAGEVLGLLPGLKDQGKLARLLVRVRHPFDPPGGGDPPDEGAGGAAGPADPLPLLVGAFVHVEIKGRTLSGLFPVPRAALREGGKIWVREGGGTLAFRAVEVVWSRGETVYLRGELKAGEQIITSRLSAPLPGMKVLLAREREGAAEAGGTGAR